MNSYPFPPSHDITVFETEDKLINITFYDLTYFNILVNLLWINNYQLQKCLIINLIDFIKLFQQHVAILEVIFAPQNYVIII